MRHLLPLALVVCAVGSPLELSGAGVGQLPPGSSHGVLPDPSTRGKQPFRNLFQPKPEVAPQPRPFAIRPSPPGRTSAPRVVCGLTVVPVDPAFDQAIRQPLPTGAPKPVIRTLPAPACEQQD